MDWSLLFFSTAMLIAGIFLCIYVGLNLTLSSILLLLLIFLHGPAYIYYIKAWGPESGYLDFVLAASAGQPVVENVNLALGIVFIGVCFGILLADFLYGRSPASVRRAIENWKPETIAFPKTDRRKLRFMLLSVGIIMLAFVIFDNQLGNVIGYFGTMGGERDKLDLRREFGGSSIYLYNLFSSNLFPFLAFCGVAAARLGKWKETSLLLVFLGLIMLSKLALLSKGPFAVLLIQLALVFAMTKSMKLSPRKILTILSFAAVTFVGMVFFVNIGQDTQGIIFDILIYRTLMIPNEGVIEYFSAIPYVLDFTWGRQLSWIAGLFQSQPQLPNYLLVGEVHRGVLGSTTTAMFVADAWADFSWFGVVIFPILVGMCVRAIDTRLLTVGKPTVWKLAGFAVGHFGLYVAMNTSFTTALLTGGLMLVIPLSLWLPRVRLNLQKTTRPKIRMADEPRKAQSADI